MINKKQSDSLYRPSGFLDILGLPVIGNLLRWRYGRLVFQLPLTLLAILLIIDGLMGPQVASRNLATVGAWVHYRGLVVLALLLVGNLFCMGCPFTLPRTLAKGLSIRGRRFPRVLRNKWLAIGSLLFLFFLYEWLDLWASPVLTAWVIIVYFVASFVMEAAFSESAFCKYVCPLGTFNFVYSTASPTQITVHDRNVCQTCVGKECINGSYQPITPKTTEVVTTITTIPVVTTRDDVLGCGTQLFAPQMRSNMDCTFCLDCVRACPHNNVALMVRVPGRELMEANAWSKRWDLSFLVIGLAFVGISNAFGMVPPVYEMINGVAGLLGVTRWGLPNIVIEGIVLLILFVVGNVALPFVLTMMVAWESRQLTGSRERYGQRDVVAAFAPAFVPLGLGIWIAHYGFHFLIGATSIVPVLQEFFGLSANWALASSPLDFSLVSLVQVVALVGSFLWSMIIAQRAALRLFKRRGVIGLLPWALLLLAMMVVSIQIFSLPMEMRGTILFD